MVGTGLNSKIIVSAAILVAVLAPPALPQQPTPGHHDEQSQSAESNHPEIFCRAKSAGQLCTHGSADVLRLRGVKRERWNEAARRYNKTVDEATKQFLKEAKETLSPEEFVKVQKWFANSVNAQLNRQLLSAEPEK